MSKSREHIPHLIAPFNGVDLGVTSTYKAEIGADLDSTKYVG